MAQTAKVIEQTDLYLDSLDLICTQCHVFLRLDLCEDGNKCCICGGATQAFVIQ